MKYAPIFTIQGVMIPPSDSIVNIKAGNAVNLSVFYWITKFCARYDLSVGIMPLTCSSKTRPRFPDGRGNTIHLTESVGGELQAASIDESARERVDSLEIKFKGAESETQKSFKNLLSKYRLDSEDKIHQSPHDFLELVNKNQFFGCILEDFYWHMNH
jgi:hypothetical protein